MAFVKDKTGSAQTAANASAVVVAAFADSFKNFDAAIEAFNDLRKQVFDDLAGIVDADNAAFAAEDSGSSNGSSKSSNRSSKGTSSRGSKTHTNGGGKSRGSKGGTISLDDALGMELNFGAFEGETLGDVLKLNSDECDSDYSYGDGEREGTDYISWLASDKNQNEYVQRRARIIADDEGIGY
jgi:hypothetical protein